MEQLKKLVKRVTFFIEPSSFRLYFLLFLHIHGKLCRHSFHCLHELLLHNIFLKLQSFQNRAKSSSLFIIGSLSPVNRDSFISTLPVKTMASLQTCLPLSKIITSIFYNFICLNNRFSSLSQYGNLRAVQNG